MVSELLAAVAFLADHPKDERSKKIIFQRLSNLHVKGLVSRMMFKDFVQRHNLEAASRRMDKHE